MPWEQSWDPGDGSLFMTPGKCRIFYGNGHVENGRCDQLMVNWWLSVGWWFGIQMGQPLSKIPVHEEISQESKPPGPKPTITVTIS